MDYVLDHDYGYGKEPETENINKLYLHNISDLKKYILDAINNEF